MKVLYPDFKIVSVEDKDQIDAVSRNFPPYCDFNFLSLYSWSKESFPTRISNINGNLVIKLKNYTDNSEIVTFLGKNKLKETITTLINDFGALSLVPEDCITNETLSIDGISITEDRNQFDYILSLKDVYDLKGNKYKSKRRGVKSFVNKYKSTVIEVKNLNDKKIYDDVVELLVIWNKLKALGPEHLLSEIEILKKEVSLSHLCELVFVCVYIGKTLVGFTSNQILDNGFALGSFGKADFRYNGIFPYLEYTTVKHLLSYGCEFLNYEQDLGLEGLRNYKLSWRPVKFLKQYKIRKLIDKI